MRHNTPATKEKSPISFVLLLIILVSFALIVAAISMLVQYSNEVAEQSSSKAAYNTVLTKQQIVDVLDGQKTDAAVIAKNVSNMTTLNDVSIYLSGVPGSPEFPNVTFARYYIGDHLYEAGGETEYLGTDTSRAVHAEKPSEIRYVGTFDDTMSADESNGVESFVGFYAPIKDDHRMVDAVVVYYTRATVYTLFSGEKIHPDARISTICTEKGEVIGGGDELSGYQILTELRNLIGEKAPIDQLEQLMKDHAEGTIPVKITGEDYLISVSGDWNKMQDLCVVELYRAKDLYSSSFSFIDTIVGIFIMFAVVAVCVVTYLLIHRARLKREFHNLETMDKKLLCPNRHGFEKEASKILERNKASYFAVVVFQLRHFKYLLDNFGSDEVDLLLSHLRLVCSKTVQLEEVYGHVEDGQFLLLLHAKDRQDLVERLKIHASRSSQHKGAHNFDVILKYGIYERDRSEPISVTQMIDYANEANNSVVSASVTNATMQFNFYSNEIRKIRLINEDMELRMEGALKNGEFQVFYQPKYNLNNDRQDGAEALVRWHDPKTNEYNRPALFMPLFESNGFIVKLDKYVFLKVCEYISYSLANGRKVFPVSVNVSRITAVQPDFVEYCAKTKSRYGIADGQIMVEFTESFAYENYETLYSITEGLHKNGFKCSIDDFGCGYSSYRILKSLPMDEIKLDKFFLEKGLNEERDSHIFESIIILAKQLGMKVTQEGVETAADLSRLRKLGCDVVQGYFYSHPLSLSDYISFVAQTHDHDLKEIQ